MSLGQIDNVDVVPQAGAVRGRVVIAKDAQALSLAYGGLGDERYEIVRNSPRKLSDKG